MAEDRLETYRRKRDFQRTPEPEGGKRRRKGGRMFVIQKHDASNLHYDFRLEIDGVLVSWAIPKGPSPDTRDKRLAIRTEDHPLDYGDFEGTIPKEQYGGGTVLVWDIGTYRNLRANKGPKDSRSMERSLDEGLVEVALEGEKLRGGWTLKHFRDDREQWLLIKMKDGRADARRDPVSSQRDSALTGRSLEEVEEEEGETADEQGAEGKNGKAEEK